MGQSTSTPMLRECCLGTGSTLAVDVAQEVSVASTPDQALPTLLGVKAQPVEIDTKEESAAEVKPVDCEPAEQGGDKASPPAAAKCEEPVQADFSAGPWRYGPRELKHMRHLGLLPKEGAGQQAPPSGSAAAVLQSLAREPPADADASGDEVLAQGAQCGTGDEGYEEEGEECMDGETGDAALRKARRKAVRKAAKKAEKQEAKAQVRAFLDRHGFVDVKSKRRWLFRSSYPLHVAVRNNDLNTVQLLLKAGASTSKVDSAGRTPRELAEKYNSRSQVYTEVIAVLRQAEEKALRRKCSTVSSLPDGEGSTEAIGSGAASSS